jgi:hypothetical protein
VWRRLQSVELTDHLLRLLADECGPPAQQETPVSRANSHLQPGSFGGSTWELRHKPCSLLRDLVAKEQGRSTDDFGEACSCSDCGKSVPGAPYASGPNELPRMPSRRLHAVRPPRKSSASTVTGPWVPGLRSLSPRNQMKMHRSSRTSTRRGSAPQAVERNRVGPTASVIASRAGHVSNDPRLQMALFEGPPPRYLGSGTRSGDHF